MKKHYWTSFPPMTQNKSFQADLFFQKRDLPFLFPKKHKKIAEKEEELSPFTLIFGKLGDTI